MLPKIPLDHWVEFIIRWLNTNLAFLFNFFSAIISGIVGGFTFLFHAFPAIVVIVLLTLLAYYFGKWRLALFAVLGLLLILNLGYWDPTMDTLALVLTSALISIILGLPLGIWCARNRSVRSTLTPVLDFMQTMPAFVYLIPAVTFFGLGVVPGVIASVIFSIPPTIRLTNLGILQVPADLVEAADAFGSTPAQKLFKVQFPLALPTILAGINQTIMLSLSMVVIASMIGAQGVGADVYRAVTQLKTGQGFEAGLAVVVLAILLDRLTQSVIGKKRKGKKSFALKKPLVIAAVAAFCIVAIFIGIRKKSPVSTSTFVGDQVGYSIIGIDPGSGLMNAAEKAIKAYNLTSWKLIEGSSTAMTIALDRAYKEGKPIIVTGWTPHWMFSKYDLKYLADTKNVFGGDEEIHSIVRLHLQSDQPSAYQFLDNFQWKPADMEQVMVKIQEGQKPEEAASQWVEANLDKVNAWISGIPKVAGKKLKLAYVAWDSEIASTNVVKYVLESKLGYQVDMLQVEAGPMWAGISSGDADAMVAGWLPTTHKDYYEKFTGKYEDLGPNLIGTKLGLVVPKYMNLTSIEDLIKK
ncbi:glycine betaine/proline transport system substrate-binding protein [Paenibacillus sp. yr247]|uniref:glycine betaine ABC transporter substrate-binding protein n=1 Tax=Paenibacillus sp. yr247 TaxID=1761880 RepID=UPI0008807B89|nr:glycine betaine ABC transporter substrate-binding protein [Paenibacillus sp. yr247]SDO54170.1 glycine betaine/proline transport system substrate-binding protein [Paenibacillus sp. yr247]